MQSYVVKKPRGREVIIEAIFTSSASQIIITTIIIIILSGSPRAPEFVTFLARWRKSGKDVN